MKRMQRDWIRDTRREKRRQEDDNHPDDWQCRGSCRSVEEREEDRKMTTIHMFGNAGGLGCQQKREEKTGR